jgi:hypothetical protein
MQEPGVEEGNCFQGLKYSLLLFFLANRAVAGPGDRFEALLLEFGFAVGANPVGTFFNTIQGVVNSLQGAAVRIGLAEQKFLGIRIGGLIGQVDGRIVVSRAALFFGAGNAFQKLFPLGLQFLFVVVETLLVHIREPTPAFWLFSKTPILRATPSVVNKVTERGARASEGVGGGVTGSGTET